MAKEIEPYYLKIAEEFIDCLFDRGYIHEDVKREDLRKLDEYLGLLFEQRVTSAVRSTELLRKIRERNNPLTPA